ncbi:MAG: HNH endonuclease [Bdellovibrionales bacterium]|nr:HNH endonuclease [Bdellovibrionales bacterium]
MGKKLSETKKITKKKGGKKLSKAPSQARSDIRSCLKEIVDPFSEKDKDSVWEFFDSHCAYCNQPIERTSRLGHMDHLVPKKDGLNHISNRVLSCNVCNGDEKRDSSWRDFILTKDGTAEDHAVRIKKIEDWVSSKTPNKEEIERIKSRRAHAEKLAKDVISVLDEKIEELKKLK